MNCRWHLIWLGSIRASQRLIFGLVILLTINPLFAQYPDYSEYGEIYPGPESACGVHCLYLAAKLQGLQPDLNNLAKKTKLSRKGTSLLDLKRAAESIGLQAKGYRYDTRDWHKLVDLMTIAHFKTNHFVLVLRTTDKGVYIADPPKHIFFLPESEFVKKWSGNVLELSHPDVNLCSPKAHTTGKEPTLIVSIKNSKMMREELNFGTILADRQHEAKIIIRNNLDVKLCISDLKSSCGCTTLKPEQEEIPPGEETTIIVQLMTGGLSAGPCKRNITTTLAAGSEKYTVIVTLKGDVFTEGRLRSFPKELTFKCFSGQQPVEQRLVVKRDSRTQLEFVGITAAEPWLTCRVFDPNIQNDKGDQIIFAVHVKDVLPTGDYEGSLIVKTKHDKFDQLKIPVKLTIEPDVQPNPKMIFCNFTQEGTESKNFDVSLKSMSKLAFSIESVRIEPSSLGTVVALLGSEADTHSIKIVLTPPLGSETIFRGKVTVVTKHPYCSEVIIPVIGKVGTQ